MLLAIDIGNTNIVLGLLDPAQEGKKTQSDKTFHPCWRLGTSHERSADEYGTLIFSLFQQSNILLTSVQGISLCCVVPPLQNHFVSLSKKLFHVDPIVIGPGVKTGMQILYDNPKEVGADRIVNAIAAYQRFHQACIIVDFGTATTFDFVTPDGKYAGGAIVPGIAISAEALFQRASKLPRVELLAPDRVIGRNTVGSIQSGLYYGSLGMVDRMIEEIMREANLSQKEVSVIATGGLAPLLVPGSRMITATLPNLTLEGLEIVFHLNQDH